MTRHIFFVHEIPSGDIIDEFGGDFKDSHLEGFIVAQLARTNKYCMVEHLQDDVYVITSRFKIKKVQVIEGL